MSVTMPRIMLLAGLLSLSSLWSTSSWALGLGEIHLNSALNEPMNADIDIIAATPEELTALRATLAPREAFTRYGIDRPPFLSSFTFKVIKKDGRREKFERAKLLQGLLKACEKRPVPVGKLEMIVDEAEQFVSEAPERERTTKDIGEHIMQKLKKLDKVAYVRFASVYLDFKDVKEFMDELKVLLKDRVKK